MSGSTDAKTRLADLRSEFNTLVEKLQSLETNRKINNAQKYNPSDAITKALKDDTDDTDDTDDSKIEDFNSKLSEEIKVVKGHISELERSEEKVIQNVDGSITISRDAKLNTTEIDYIRSIVHQKMDKDEPSSVQKKPVSLTPKRVKRHWHDNFSIREFARSVLISNLRVRSMLSWVCIPIAIFALFVVYYSSTSKEISLTTMSIVLILSLLFNLALAVFVSMSGTGLSSSTGSFTLAVTAVGLLLSQMITLSIHLGSARSNIPMMKAAAFSGVGASLVLTLLQFMNRLSIARRLFADAKGISDVAGAASLDVTASSEHERAADPI